MLYCMLLLVMMMMKDENSLCGGGGRKHSQGTRKCHLLANAVRGQRESWVPRNKSV